MYFMRVHSGHCYSSDKVEIKLCLLPLLCGNQILPFPSIFTAFVVGMVSIASDLDVKEHVVPKHENEFLQTLNDNLMKCRIGQYCDLVL